MQPNSLNLSHASHRIQTDYVDHLLEFNVTACREIILTSPSYHSAKISLGMLPIAIQYEITSIEVNLVKDPQD